MENYFNWLQNTMSASPWGNTDLNKKLLSYATENVSAAFGYVQKLSQAIESGRLVKIQTEFMSAQMNSFNEQAKNIGEICTKTRLRRERRLVSLHDRLHEPGGRQASYAGQ